MNVLLLSPHSVFPPSHGTASRILHLARELQLRHSVTVVAFDGAKAPREPADAPFDYLQLQWRETRAGRVGRWVTRFGMLARSPISENNVHAIRRVLDSRRIDVVVAQNLLLAPLLPLLRDRPVVWVADGIVSELRLPSLAPRRNPYRHLQDWLEYGRWRRLETWTWRQAQALVGVSEVECAALESRVSRKIPVVLAPNGVDIAYFAETPQLSKRTQALFVGSRWFPNVEALQFFVREILPRIRHYEPEFRLVVAGDVRESRELRLPPLDGVAFTGFVDDLRPLMAESRLSVAPILRGHGTRTKILDAMAAGVPVVSTHKGAEGLDVEHGVHLLLADRADEFAAAVWRVLRDEALAARLAQSARQRVVERYQWAIVAAGLESAVDCASRARGKIGWTR